MKRKKMVEVEAVFTDGYCGEPEYKHCRFEIGYGEDEPATQCNLFNHPIEIADEDEDADMYEFPWNKRCAKCIEVFGKELTHDPVPENGWR